MIVGFDVGGTNARALLIDPRNQQVVDRARQPSRGPGNVLRDRLASMVRTLADRNGVEVEAVGLGVAGLAHRSGIVYYSPNLPELVEYPLGTELQSELGVPVTVMNDATAGTWAEAKAGAGRGSNHFAFVALGTGIGTGFVSDGNLIQGSHGFAGESGHMVIDISGPPHITGQRGPWEYYASGSALGRMGREASAAGRFDAGLRLCDSPDEITGFQVVEALRNGDAQAAAILDDFSGNVALGIANLVMVFDSDRVVLGGGLSEIGEPLRHRVAAWLPKVVLGSAHRPPIEVVLAELGDDAGALGAALFANQQMMTSTPYRIPQIATPTPA